MKKLILLLSFLALCAPVHAAVKWIGPTATCSAGDGTGDSQANCLKNCSTASTLVGHLETGGNEYRILPGTYTNYTSCGGNQCGVELSSNTKIKGYKSDGTEITSLDDADLVIFSGVDPTTYDVSNRDATSTYGFQAVNDADNIELTGFTVRLFRYNIDFAGKTSIDSAPTTGYHENIVIRNVISEQTDQALNIAGDTLTKMGVHTISSMSTTNDTITVATTPATAWTHAENDPVAVLADTMPGGLSKYTRYFVKNYNSSTRTFQLSTTAGGSAINLTGSIANGVAYYAPPASGNSSITFENFIARNYARTGIRQFHRVASASYTNIYVYGTDKDAWTNGTVTTSDTTSPYNGDIVTATAHGLTTGQPIIVKASTMPGGLTERTVLYWPVNITTDTFSIAATEGGAAINLTGTPVSFQWNKCYNTAEDQTGMQFGGSSNGTRSTAEWGVTITNLYGSDHNDRKRTATQDGQGDVLVAEEITSGTVNTAAGSPMSYGEYSTDAAIDTKGTWTIGTLGSPETGFIARRNLFQYKSYGDYGAKLTVNHSFGLNGQCNGGLLTGQCGDPRILQLFGDMDVNFSTLFDHSSNNFKIAKLQTTFGGPVLNISDSLIGYFNTYSGTLGTKYQIATGGVVNETRVSYYEDETPTGTNPQFVDVTDRDFDGSTDHWNPQLAAYAGGLRGAYIAVGGSSPGALSSTNVQPASLQVSAAGNVTCTFTTEQALPATGKIKIHFPTTLGSGFSFNSGGTTAASGLSGLDGTLTVGIASNVVTLTRGGGATETPLGTTCSFTLSFVQNPGAPGSTGVYKIYTTTSGDVVIDQDEAVTADTIADPPAGNTGLATISGTITFSGTVRFQ